jgi:uncharacterized protein
VIEFSAIMRCPICGKEAKPRTQNPCVPFCSPRCKQVDLGKWLNEEYRVYTDEKQDAEEEANN